jgi:molybdenum cofactor sulfurtransferase
LIDEVHEKMTTNLYGNPHSSSDPANLSGNVVDSIREKALNFFKADPQHFDLVFVANATAAIKLVSEGFRDLASASSSTGNFWYGFHKDAHTSLIGIREQTNGNHHCFSSDQEVEDWLDGATPMVTSSESALPGLFAYPGQSNMTGRRLPLSWTAKLRQSNRPQHQNTYSLLDAAALATTTQIDLSDPEITPDFVSISFYKIFGFPDLGALIIRKNSGHILSWRRYFGGGTVNGLTVFHETTVRRRDESIHDALEDGTLPFHNIMALGCAIDAHSKLYGSMKVISRHTCYLARRLYLRLASLQHYNGRPLVVFYNDFNGAQPYSDPTTQGSTIAFNLVRADGSPVRHSMVEKMANDRGIFLRSGGLCNAGGIASYLNVEPWQFKRAWSAGHRCGKVGDLEIINGKPTGVVRASLGAMTTIREVETLVVFLIDTFIEYSTDEQAASISEVPSRAEVPASFIPAKEAQQSYDAFDIVDIDNALPKLHKLKRQTSSASGKETFKPQILRPKRSFFGRRISTDRIRPVTSEASPGYSEYSGTTISVDDIHHHLNTFHPLPRRAFMALEENHTSVPKNKNSLKFWKASKVIH